MRDIIDNWRSWKDQLLIEQDTLKITKRGIQPKDPNVGKDYVKIAESEFQQWLGLGNPRHGDPSGKWRQPIAKYWASIGKGFKYFVPKTLSPTGSKNQLYGKGKKNPKWSAAFIQYCMIASGDSSWNRVNGSAPNSGTISNHRYYWSGMFDNSLKLQAKKQLSADDWVFVPLTEADQQARGNRTGKILFTGSDIGYTKPKPGDLVLIVSKKGNREGYHGDIVTSSGRVGGNTTASGGRVGDSASPAVVILTKNPLVKKNVLQVLNNKKQER